MKLFVLGFVLILLTACAAPAASSSIGAATTATVAAPTAEPTARLKATLVPRATMAATPTTAISADDTLNIVLQRSGGFTGRTEVFVLKPDGTITMAFGNVKAPGGSAAALQLAQHIIATSVLGVPPGEYVPANGCCDRYLFELTLGMNGKSYHYATLEGDDSAPPALRETLALIQQYINGAQ